MISTTFLYKQSQTFIWHCVFMSEYLFRIQNIFRIIAFYDFILYRYSSSTKDTHYTLLLSVKEECCWRDVQGYCTLHPVRMNFENFNGGSSTVYAVSSKIPYQGSSNHYNSFLKVISCQCKLQLYICMGNMYKLNNAGVK